MGWTDFLKKKDKETEKPATKTEKKPEPVSKQPDVMSGHKEECALCGKGGTEKKWAGQYWHKQCLRRSRKSAKGMI